MKKQDFLEVQAETPHAEKKEKIRKDEKQKKNKINAAPAIIAAAVPVIGQRRTRKSTRTETKRKTNI